MLHYSLTHIFSYLTLVFSLVMTHSCAMAVTVVDDQGVAVTVAQTPKRIVSLLPSLTETVCALDRCNALVGVDRYSNFPETVLKLPKVGGGLDPNIEAIVALKPDLVLLASSTRAATRLRSLGISVLSLEPKTYGQVQKSFELLGKVLNTPNAHQLWKRIQADIDKATSAVPASYKGAKVYFEVSPAPHAASSSSFVGETLSRLGLNNIVPDQWGEFPKINPEFVVQSNPDVIMLSEAQIHTLASRPGWARLQAIQKGRVCSFNAQESDILSRPGPRMALGAALIAKCLSTLSL